MRRVLGLVVVALVAASCGGGSDGKPDTTTTSPASPDTTAVVVVTTEPPTTVDTVPRGSPRTPTTQLTTMGPGSARIVGTVTGPEGPVTGAIVRVERFVGSAVATADTRTQGGSWSIDSILGGSYRVTIFRPPDLAQGGAEVFFLGADETKTLSSTLVRLGENSITAVVDPNPPVVGQPTVLTVRFGSGGVDGDGRVIVTPRPGVRVQLNMGQGLALDTVPVVISDGAGAASWQFRCVIPGQFPASILVGNASSALVLPACVAAPAAPAARAEPAEPDDSPPTNP